MHEGHLNKGLILRVLHQLCKIMLIQHQGIFRKDKIEETGLKRLYQLIKTKNLSRGGEGMQKYKIKMFQVETRYYLGVTHSIQIFILIGGVMAKKTKNLTLRKNLGDKILISISIRVQITTDKCNTVTLNNS